MTSPKIQKTHLERQAVIYIRQSSPLQVEMNVESKRRQYQLVERVQTLGWHETQCTVIDDDQAISGAQSYNRPGFQQVISMMALREVGIILGLEVARLARNCLDWYQLLEVAGVFDVLVADEDGIYISRFQRPVSVGHERRVCRGGTLSNPVTARAGAPEQSPTWGAADPAAHWPGLG